jgi:hypothetical protein
MAHLLVNRIGIFGREIQQRIIPVVRNGPDDGIARIGRAALGSRLSAAAQQEQGGETPQKRRLLFPERIHRSAHDICLLRQDTCLPDSRLVRPNGLTIEMANR